MKNHRYLTKSRFKLGIECPTKLYYKGKQEYLNQKIDDPFLIALAKGGYQVGELAKQYFPNGHDITTLDYEDAETQTLKLLEQSEVIIYEPAIRFKNLFVRIDILVKKGNQFELIEVKSKSFDTDEGNLFLNKNGTIKSGWKPYLFDIAFQKYVLTSAFPKASVTSFLMLVDKNAKCPIEGLNQKFKVVRDEKNRKGIKVISNTLPKECLDEKILIQVSVDKEIQLIYDGKDSNKEKERSFFDEVTFLAEKYKNNEKIISDIGSKCKECEFQCSKEEEQNGFKNGLKECWSSKLGWSDKDFEDKNILSIWNFRCTDKLIKEGKIKLTDLDKKDVNPKCDSEPGMSRSERQWCQVEMAQKKETNPFLDFQGLQNEMDKWKFPLHFIDFETSRVALPFNRGRKPYEGIAFQFSHHIVHEDGAVEHAGQYLNTKQGIFPNYEFVRRLKDELEKDRGTIFRYHHHENTYLNIIYRQLSDDPSDISDRKALCEFIKSITKSTDSSFEKWDGDRCMVDMCRLVERFFYDPHTNKGSISIKHILPAFLNSSTFLQEKYSQPIYGSLKGIKSSNFKNWKWIEWKEGSIIEPYNRLPKMFQDVSDKNVNLLSEEDELSDGGAALMAYGRLQFSEITEYEKQEIESALLKYCELDTLAMVMIYEAWRDMLNTQLKEEKIAG